jgi:flagellum-specific ATP synthase
LLPGPNPDRNLDRALRLGAYIDRVLDNPPRPVVEGILRRSVGLTMEAEGCHAPVGGRCDVIAEDGRRVDCEVVGFAGERLFLMPAGDMRGIVPNARVIPRTGVPEVLVGDDLLGRVLDGRGRPLDGGAALAGGQRKPLSSLPVNPLERQPIRQTLDVGIRTINALLTVGRGQRLGLFAGSGVGKSMLLGMMTRNTAADVVVVGLVGERGREVREFIDTALGPEGLKKAVVVATPADDTPLMRLHGAWLSSAIAEYFRDSGRHVLLLMDSLTRFAQAQREIGLAIGEPPTAKGYPPTVFTELPRLLERAGPGLVNSGSVTGLFTVLVEGDDHNEPIADAVRGILDGHIVMERTIAERGRYPAVNVLRSISRTMPGCVPVSFRPTLQKAREFMSVFSDMEELIRLGAYRKGSDPKVDRAIAIYPALEAFLSQHREERMSIADGYQLLEAIIEKAGAEPGVLKAAGNG